MPRKPLEPFLDQVLQAWRVNHWITVKLIGAIPKKGFYAVPLGSRGRTVHRQLMQMHNVHLGWLRHKGVALSGAAKPFTRDASPTENSDLWYSGYGGEPA